MRIRIFIRKFRNTVLIGPNEYKKSASWGTGGGFSRVLQESIKYYDERLKFAYDDLVKRNYFYKLVS